MSNKKPYVDRRELLVANTAETREYRLRWWDDGEWGPVKGVSVV